MAFMLIITVVSVVVAVVASALAWRLMRDERRRSDARVAALADDIHHAPSPSPVAELALNEAPHVAINELFGGTSADDRREGSWPRLARVAAIGAVVVTMAGLAIVTLSSGSHPSGPRSAGTAGTAATDATGPAEHDPAPLELVALGHEREDDRLTVHGVVRNPARGAEVSHLTAVVLMFNQNGAFVTSGRATVDASALEPGAEAPFVVTVPGAADVGRYRVSFRTDDHVVPHVDKRS